MKNCTKCKLNKSKTEFHKNQNKCKACVKIYCKEYNKRVGVVARASAYAKNPKNIKRIIKNKRDSNIRIKYKIESEDYDSLFESQDGVCAICGLPETEQRKGQIKMLSVDHNHETGKVRGLLCGNCNIGIGNLQDNLDILASAVSYLQQPYGL